MLIEKGNRRLGFSALIVGLLSFIGLCSWAAPATAGQGAAAPAGIIGQVTDGTGAVLPGVTITATSPALQVPQVVTVSDERGEYRLSPLPIGTYTVTYELAGFQNLRREGVRLTVGFVAKLDQVLNLGSFAETVSVSGASPVVDVTNTAARTDLSTDAVELLPTTRDGIKALLTQVPGARPNLDVAMSSLTDGPQFRVYGQLGFQWFMVEGVLNAVSGAHTDLGSIEQTRVQTVGSNAEMPSRGLLVDSVVKSGGNDFHGEFVAFGGSGRFESNNVTEALRAQGVTGAPKLHTLRDILGNLGGRIVRNKLWFYGGYHYAGYDREVLDAFHDDGTPVVLNSWLAFDVEKLSYQMTPGNRLIGFHHRVTDFQRRGASFFNPPESRVNAKVRSRIAKGEWQAVRGNSLFTSVQFGKWDHKRYRNPLEGQAPKVATRDIATQFVSGDNTTIGEQKYDYRYHTKGVVSWYRPNLLSGNHEFKAGFDSLASADNLIWLSRDSGNYELLFNNGAPFQIITYNYPVDPQNQHKYVGLYAQDAWTFARRLTLNLGIRYANDRTYAPPQCQVATDFAAAQCWERISMATWNSVAPRLHAAFDLFGDGKTVIKGGWGRFVHFRQMSAEIWPITRNNPINQTWNWHDLNGNRLYDPGEVNLDPNGPDFQGVGGGVQQGGGVTFGVPNPNEKQPKSDEFSLTFEREVIANWAVRATGIYARNFNNHRTLEINRPPEVYNIPITNRDPGPDGQPGTADDPGTFITYYDYPAALAGARFATTMLINDPRADSTFKTIEVATTRRFSEGWQLMTSYTATKINIPFNPRLAFNPNAEIFAAQRTWEWQYKLSGAYTLPYGILAAANFDHRSGDPQARQVLFTGGRQIRSIVLNVEPIGTIRLPATNVLDVRAGKRFRLGTGRSLELRADVYNALNVAPITRMVVRSGATYLRPVLIGTSETQLQPILLPRILQLGVTYSF